MGDSGVTDETKRIIWPLNNDMIMSMLGFEEAYNSALKIRLSNEPDLQILVPSVPALALLKIISWADAYPRREHDAQDLLFILENYEATGIEDQLYESHAPLLTEEGYDPRLASVRLLGRDIAQLCSQDTLNTVTEILKRETDEEQDFRMLSHMVKRASFQGVKFEAALHLLKKLLQGLQERKR
jgi:predicted nucleotidyltransferase